MSIIRLENINFSYHNPLILENINFTLHEGEFVGLVGPNGGGKSTLLKIILGLINADSGRVLLFEQAVRKSREKVGYVPQFANFIHDFPISVEQLVCTGRLAKKKRFFYNQFDKACVKQALIETEIEALASRNINQLSGGQLQRALIARALASQPELLILDEPTANIDSRMEKDIFDLFKSLNKRMTILVVSHDIGFISSYITRIACLSKTLVCHDANAIEMTDIQALYHKSVQKIHHD